MEQSSACSTGAGLNGGGRVSTEANRRELSWQQMLADIAGKLLLLFLLVGFPIALAGAPKTFNDGDVSWHVDSGRWMLAHLAIPTTDPFSFTAKGHPWVAMEWLADLIYASAYSLDSYAGLAVVVAIAIVALHAILYVHLRGHVGPIGIAAAMVCIDVICSHFTLARPHVLVWPIIAGWTVVLLNSLQTKRPPPFWSLVLLVAWTNIHASFPLALLIAGGVALDAMIDTKWNNWKPWALFLLASTGALMLNANGFSGLIQPFHVTALKMLPSIDEWQASTPTTTPEFYAVLLFGLCALLRRGTRVPIGQLFVLLVLLALSFSQVRHQSWFVIVAVLVFTPLLRTGGSMNERVAPYLMAAAALLAARAWLPNIPNESAANPRHLLAAVPTELRSRPVLNGYSLGGPLILAGIRPYIDGRAEMYGDAFFADYVKITDGDFARFNRAVNRYDIRWTLLPYGNAALIKELDASPSWRRIYADKVGVIHVRVR